MLRVGLATAVLVTIGTVPAQAATENASWSRFRQAASAWETLIDNSFADRPALTAEWNFRYPWGSDHNGSARMIASATDNSHVYLPSSGVLEIKASPVSGLGNIPHPPPQAHN